MDDFIELGIEGCDKLIDKHFHKIPDKYLDRHTYSPRNLRSQNRRRSSSGSPPPSKSSRLEQTRSNADLVQKQEPQQNRHGNGGEIPYPQQGYSAYTTPFPPMYNDEPPPHRLQYVPVPPENRARRPKVVSRRSSSYPDLHRRRDQDAYPGAFYFNHSHEKRRDSNPDVRSSSRRYKARDSDNQRTREESRGRLTGSTEGLVGAGVGAMVGGWAAMKAQSSTSTGNDEKKRPNDALTLLGAAVGGLAVNAFIDRWEDKKKVSKGK